MKQPSSEQLVKVLQAASAAHHDFEANALQGKYDDQWPGWYAAYIVGRLGDFVTPTILAGWLSVAPESDDWPRSTADHIGKQFGIT